MSGTSYSLYDDKRMGQAPDGSSVATGSSPSGPVHRAFALLQLVVTADEPIGVRELSRRAGLSRSTTVAHARDPGRDRHGGAPPQTAAPDRALGWPPLTRRVEQSPAVLRDRFRPLVLEMQRAYGENAAVGIDDGAGFLYLVSARVPAAVQVADPIGATYPYHLVAPGLIAMAHWPADRLADHLARPLERATKHSVVAPSAIRRRLGTIRKAGYAWTDQELDLEVNGLAAPILAAGGGLLAVATLYGPSYRFAESRQPGLGREFAEFVAERTAPRRD